MAVVLGRKGGGGSSGGGPPSGAAGGILSGTYPNPGLDVAAKGDLLVGTGVDTASLLTAGANGTVPTYQSGQATGILPQFPPGYEFHYKQITANVTVSSATEATGTTIITCDATTFDGGPVIAEFFAVVAPDSAAGQDVLVSLFEGATQISRLAYSVNPAASGDTKSLVGKLRFTPTAASHTYTVTGIRLGGSNGTIIAGSGGTGGWPPAYIRFTKV